MAHGAGTRHVPVNGGLGTAKYDIAIKNRLRGAPNKGFSTDTEACRSLLQSQFRTCPKFAKTCKNEHDYRSEERNLNEPGS